jgi:hypothetical protein
MEVLEHPINDTPFLTALATQVDMNGYRPMLVVEEPLCRQTAASYSGKCSDQGGLHEARIKNTKRVHCFETASSGAYIGKNFGTTPHYNIDSTQYCDFATEAMNKDIPVKRYDATRNHVTDPISIVNLPYDDGISPDDYQPDEIQSRLSKEMAKLDFEGVFVDLWKKKLQGNASIDGLRGTTQQHFGYAGNHSLKRSDDGHAVPVLVNEKLMDNKVRTSFSDLTGVADLMYGHMKQTQTGKKRGLKKGWRSDSDCLDEDTPTIFNDSGQHLKYSTAIHPNNRIDAMTTSLSSSADFIQIHCDILNDDTPLGISGNYHYVIVTWKCFLGPDGSVYRVAIIGYSRRSVSDAIRRKGVVDTLYEEKIEPWIARQGSWRSNVDVDEKIFHRSYFPESCARIDEATGIMGMCPMFNKQAGLLSGFADSFLKFKEQFPCIMESIHKCCELILPIGFCNTAQKYRSVVSSWIRDNDSVWLKKNNLVTAMLATVSENSELGSLSSGLFRRFQPTFNRHSLSLKWISSALRKLKETVLLCRTSKSMTFATACARICSIKGFGHLIAQHIIHMLALVSMIPARFAADATVCESTSTYKRLEKIHGISRSKLPTLVAVLDKKYGWPSFVSENVICKWAIDEYKEVAHLEPSVTRTTYYDCLYPDQEYILYCKKNQVGEYGIRVVKRGKHQPNRYSTYVTSNWVDRTSTTATKDPSAHNDLLWTCTNDTCLGEKNVYMTNKAKVHNNVDRISLTSVKRRSNCRRSRSKFQQTRWGTVVTEDPEMGGNDYGTKKRRKVHGVPNLYDDSTGYWKAIDCKEFRKEEMEFIKTQRKIQLSGVSSYGVECHQGSHHLRQLHQEGRLKVTPPRTTNKNRSHSGLRPCAHIMALGVISLPFDLRQASALALQQKSFDAILPFLEEKESGGGYYSVITLNSSVISLKNKERYAALVQGQSPSTSSRGLDRDFPIIYSSKAASRIALLWYICASYGRPELWITRMYREDEWTFPKGNLDGVAENSASYLVLQQGGGCGGKRKGNEFAILEAKDGKVVCRLNQGALGKKLIVRRGPCSNSHSTFCLFKGNPYNMGISPRTKQSRRMIQRETGVSQKTERHHPDTTPNQTTTKVLLSVEITDCRKNGETQESQAVRAHRLLAQLKKRRSGRRVEKISVFLDTPLKTLRKTSTISEKNVLLLSWSKIWTDRLDDWFSYVVFRTADDTFDTYWIPPHSDGCPTLRSGAEIIRYISHAKKQMDNSSNPVSTCTFDIINKTWCLRTAVKQ